jgi:hypothetical protein
MQLTGQLAAQVPQSTQSSALITYLPSSCEMQSTGQLAWQTPQPTHSSLLILYAIKTPPKQFLLSYHFFAKKQLFFCYLFWSENVKLPIDFL